MAKGGYLPLFSRAQRFGTHTPRDNSGAEQRSWPSHPCSVLDLWSLVPSGLGI